jgi:hypothetical protein
MEKLSDRGAEFRREDIDIRDLRVVVTKIKESEELLER